MYRTHNISQKGVTERYSEAIPRLRSPGDYVLVVRGLPRSIVMVCPDGCGETITINLDQRIGKAWRTFDKGEKLTIFPSVWRDTGCRAHFIIWRDQILWCDGSPSRASVEEDLVRRTFEELPLANYLSFELVAERLKEIPWEILWACEELVSRGFAQATGNRAEFRRIKTVFAPQNKGSINTRA